MKKRLIITTMILLVIGTFTYIQSYSKVLSKENISYITITNNCNEEIYGIHYEIKNNERLNVGGIFHANGTLIKEDEVLTIAYSSSDFYNHDELTEFTIEFFAILEGAKEISCGNPIKLNIESDESYNFSLSGNKINGFIIEIQ